ncbi:MAG: hypothetical protein N2203_00760 [Bacteroidia bacterium]|nr:hypothetical protein [Bacteroidia bacterium]
MRLFKWKLFWVAIIPVIFSIKCKQSVLADSEKQECVVTYKENCLDKKEIAPLTQNYNKQDSIRIAQSYVKEWLVKEKLYEEAQKKILINEKEIEKLATDITKQYIISEYLKTYIQENMDTSISEQEIMAYYQQHKNSFKLANNIVQIYYVKLNDNEKDISVFKKMLSNYSKDKTSLNNFIREKSMSYFIEDSLWLKWDDVIREIPYLKTYEINSLSKGKVMEWRDGIYYRYIKIKDYKVKDEYSPFVYEKEKIRSIILNERKNNLITTLKNQMLLETGYKEK